MSPMNLEKQLQKKAMQLEREAKILKENGPQKLLAKRKQLQKELKQLEAEIQRVFAKLKIPLSPETPAARTPRASRPAKGRMGADEIQRRIEQVLKKNTHGLGRRELSKVSGVYYGSVLNFVKKNAARFAIDGKGKKAVYRLVK